MSDMLIRNIFNIAKNAESEIKKVKAEEVSDGIKSDLIISVQSMAYTKIKSELKKYKKQIKSK